MMSAKTLCKFTPKMEPLVKGFIRNFETIDEFAKWVSETFDVSDFIKTADQDPLGAFVNFYWTGGTISTSPIKVMDLEQKTIGDISVTTIDGNARAAYGSDEAGFKNMKSSFLSNIVEKLIFDKNSGVWFDPLKETESGYTYMDIELFKYKQALLNSLRTNPNINLSELDLDPTSSTFNLDFTKAYNETLAAYSNLVSTSGHPDDRLKMNYVILSNFNSLLLEYAPFITIRPAYKYSGTQGIMMYEYVGPKANLRVSWTKDEIIGAQEQYSGLATTLLNYFQEWDHGFIPNTSIGVSGFVATMKRLRNAILYSGSPILEEAKKSFYSGKFDLGEAIKAYISAIDQKEVSKDYSTSLAPKLNGILYSIYANESIPQDIKEMFTRMFFETVPLKYRTIGTYGGKFRGTNLEDNWRSSQNYRLQDSINGKILGYRTNPDAWSAVKQEFNIRYSDNSNSQSGDILISFEAEGQKINLKFSYSFDRTNSGKINLTITPDEFTKVYGGKMAERLIYATTGYLVTPEYKNYSKYTNGDENGILNDFAGAIVIGIMGSMRSATIDPLDSMGILDRKNNVIDFYKGYLFNHLDVPASIISLVSGSETANTVRDVNGNNLPTNGLTSLAYDVNEFIERYGDSGSFQYSLAALNPHLIGTPVIKEGVSLNGRGKKTKGMNVRELYETGIVFDYLDALSSGHIYLQPTTDADKTKILLNEFNLLFGVTYDPDGRRINLQNVLQNIANGNLGLFNSHDTSSTLSEINNVLWTLRHNKVNQIEQTLVEQYNNVLGTYYTSLEQIDKHLETHHIKYNDLRQMFRNYPDEDYQFIEEFTATKGKNKTARINETLLHQTKIYGFDPNNEIFLKRLDRTKRRFAHDLISDGLRLNPYTTKGGRLLYDHLMKTSGTDWIEENSKNIILAKIKTKSGVITNITKSNVDLLLDPNNSVIINPVLESYYYADNILCGDFNSTSIGEFFAHANKNKIGDPTKIIFDGSEREEFDEASRWVSSVKRNVILGASIHPLLQGKWDGVAETIKVAAMEDIPASTFNMLGVTKDNDSMDGSGIGNIWQMLLEANSFKDAAPKGFDFKTIGWDLDENGIPMMLKWAVYGITNERRRKGFLASTNLENLYKRMCDIRFDKYIDFNKYFTKYCPDGFWFKNPNTDKKYHVTTVTGTNVNGNIIFYRTAETESGEIVYLDKNNNEHSYFSTLDANLYSINTIYDIDMFFGGAWAQKTDNGEWINDDLNYRAVLDIICSENLKDKFIAYAVNKSAMKVGVRNLNTVDIWSNNKALDYFTMSTKHIGIQMNAEHELEFAEVTEMTQMISALAENWYAGELVKDIYKSIGEVVEESLSQINIDIRTDKRDSLRERFGKALIESFDKKEDTIGLAQAFLNKARQALENEETPNIPFSAATINGAFIADVASRLTKKGIRRKYAGIAAVLSPAYSIMPYFRFVSSDGNTKTVTSEAIPSEIRKEFDARGLTQFSTTNLWSLCNSAVVYDDFGNLVLNPLIDSISRHFDIKQGDTIVIETSPGFYDTVKIEKWDDYNKYVNVGQDNVVGKLKFAPKELQGADTTFDINGENFSIYNLQSVQALHLLRYNDFTLAEAILADAYWNTVKVTDAKGNLNIKRSLQNIVQKQLEDLEKGILHDSLFKDERGYTITLPVNNVQVHAAECIMGKSYAKQFGLEIGDNIEDILNQGWRWFYDKFESKYGVPKAPSDLMDCVIYTSEGPIIVKFGKIQDPSKYNLTRNTQIQNVDGDLVLNDEILCSAENVETYKYTNGEDNYTILTINDKEHFNELLDSNLVETYKFAITKHNLRNYFLFTEDNRFGSYVLAYKKDEISNDDLVETVNRILRQEYVGRLKDLSKQRFNAFKASLNIVGARIPTQAMQSFMPMKVVAFTDSETNDIYVNRQQLWLQGSDLDIDKVYCLQYSIAPNGTLPTMSRLSKYYDAEQVLKLGKPNGIKYSENNEDSILITQQELAEFNSGNIWNVFKRIFNSGKSNISFEVPGDVEINITLNGKQIKELNAKRIAEFNSQKEKFLETLNLHSLSKIRVNKEMALRNMVVSGILDVCLKPSVQGNANTPVDMDEASAAGEASVLGNLEKHFSPDIPSSKWKLQEQALGAKDVVGISAVSVKCFFAETTYMNIAFEGFADTLISGDEDTAMQILSNLIMENPITGKAAVVANTNLNKVIDKLKKAGKLYTTFGIKGVLNEASWWTEDKKFNLIKCLEDLNIRASVIDCALSQSGLLSSATDNMKELILPKINATAQFVDIYTSLLATGVSFSEIANIMTSPMFTEMSRLTQSNILDVTTSGYRLKTALEFFLNNRPLPRVKRPLIEDAFRKAGFSYDQLDIKDQMEKTLFPTTDINFVTKALNEAYRFRINKVYTGSQEDYNGDEDLFMEDYFGEDYVGSNAATLETASLEDLNYLINYLEECLNRQILFKNLNELAKTPEYKRFGSTQDQLRSLRIVLNKILPKTEEQQIFGRMLGINQGLRTKAYEMHSMIRSIENFVNGRFYKNGLTSDFVLMEFLKDEQKRIKWIEDYGKVKSSINILDAITKIPHFSKMFEVLYSNEFIQSSLSSKHQLVNEIARTLELENPYREDEPFGRILNEKEYNEVERYVNDWYITGWLAQQNFQISLPVGVGRYESLREITRNTSNTILRINSLYDFASFKHLMETRIIPDLQKNTRYKDNSFIMSLEYGVTQNKKTHKWQRSYRLPINMMTIDDSIVTTNLYANYLNAFDKIAQDSYKGSMKLGDLFFLYNLIVNKDSFGQSSMTRIFESLVSAKRGSPLINSFYDYIAEIDRMEDRTQLILGLTTDTNLEDLKARIHQNVATTNITPSQSVIDKLETMHPDFTFGMPYTTENWTSIVPKIYPLKVNSQWGKIQLDHDTIKNEVLDRLVETLGRSNVIVESQSWFDVNFDKDPLALESPAFIHDGKVYIKRQDKISGNSIAHEFAHVVLAALRFSSNDEYKQFYYNVIGNINISEAIKELELDGDTLEKYQRMRTGIDLKEEIFAKYLEKWMLNRISSSTIGNFLMDSQDKIKDVINLVFGTDISKINDLLTFTNAPLSDAINAFGSSLFNTNWAGITSSDFLITAQKVASLKKFLTERYEKQKLIEKCD